MAGVAAHVCWIAPAPRSCASRKLGVLKSAIGTGKVQHVAFPDQFSEVRERRAPSICQRASNNGPCRHPKARSGLGTRAGAERVLSGWSGSGKVVSDLDKEKPVSQGRPHTKALERFSPRWNRTT